MMPIASGKCRNDRLAAPFPPEVADRHDPGKFTEFCGLAQPRQVHRSLRTDASSTGPGEASGLAEHRPQPDQMKRVLRVDLLRQHEFDELFRLRLR